VKKKSAGTEAAHVTWRRFLKSVIQQAGTSALRFGVAAQLLANTETDLGSTGFLSKSAGKIEDQSEDEDEDEGESQACVSGEPLR
jgi:hypothetical protein